ncbi:hypothetical protein CYMTET_56210 [Cymbomonas tetramitiformis]|uniref:EF-hand domain-containing protein n=1 Tax=Cymbomonas tetramitiformis TaxID=36881 RepID=A0AAE0EMK1_9CHLO|nr:hypothetical protein CYMTET_56210 [Cymbomonas tetramitiformis]
MVRFCRIGLAVVVLRHMLSTIVVAGLFCLSNLGTLRANVFATGSAVPLEESDHTSHRADPSNRHLEESFQHLDADDDGIITWTEFVSGRGVEESAGLRLEGGAGCSEESETATQSEPRAEQLVREPINVTTRLPLAVEENIPMHKRGTSRCVDSIVGWVDIDGDDCATYETARYCTIDGEDGDGLDEGQTLAQYGVNGTDAADVCCICGAGRPAIRVAVQLDLLYSDGSVVDEATHHDLAAISMAIKEINANASLLPHHELLFAVGDGHCILESGGTVAYELAQWGADVAIGTSCSSSSASAQEVYEYYAVPQVSSSATSSTLSAMDNVFMRTVASDAFQAKAMADFVHQHNWTHAATVAREDSYGLDGVAGFHEEAETLGISVSEEHRITYAVGTEDFSAQVQALLDTQVFIIVTFGHAVETGRLMEQAYAAGLAEGYVWIGSEATASSATWEAMSANLTEAERNAIMKGYIGVRPFMDTTTPEYVAFEERWRRQPATLDETGECSAEEDDAGQLMWRQTTDENLTVCIGANYSAHTEMSIYTPLTYDAAYTVAHALHGLLAEDPAADLGAALFEAMRTQAFTGASGSVAFDAAGDRTHGVQFSMVNHAGGSALRHVGTWSMEQGYKHCADANSTDCYPIVWSTGDTPPAKSQFLKLGVMLNMRESSSPVAALMLAMREITGNSSLLPDHKLLFSMLDVRCSDERGRIAAKHFVQHWGADVVLGATCSSASVAAQEVLVFDLLPQISHSSTSTELTSSSDLFMRTIPSDLYQGRAMADFVHRQNWTRVATVAVQDGSGTSGVREFIEKAEALEVAVPTEDRLTYSVGTTDFGEVIAALKATRAYIIVTFGHAAEIGQLMEQAYAAGVGGKGYVWIGNEATASSATWEAMSANLTEAERNAIMKGYIGVRPFIDTTTPEYVAFEERWRRQPATLDETGECSAEEDDAGQLIWWWEDDREDGNDTAAREEGRCIGLDGEKINRTDQPDFLASFMYDAMYVVVHALHEHHHWNGEAAGGAALWDAMLAQSFAGVSGPVAFETSGDRSASGVWYELVNHAGDGSGLRHVGNWSRNTGYHPCSAEVSSVECNKITWSTDNNTHPTTSYVKIGLMSAMTGKWSADPALAVAMVMAIEEVNSNPALLSDYRLLYSLRDTQCDRARGAAAAEELVAWGADVVVGAYCSLASTTAQRVLQRSAIPQISGSSSGISLSRSVAYGNGVVDPYPYFMRTIPSDTYQTVAMAGVLHHFNLTRTATVAVQDSDGVFESNYGIYGMMEFHRHAKHFGIDIPDEWQFEYAAGTTDFSALVQALKATRSNIIVTFGHAGEIGRLMEQAYAAGVGGKGYLWIGNEACTTSATWEAMSANLTEAERNAIMKGYIGVRSIVNWTAPEYVAFEERWRRQPATVDEAGECSAEEDDAGLPMWRRYDADSNLTSYDLCVGMTAEEINRTDPIDKYAVYGYDAVYVVMYSLHVIMHGLHLPQGVNGAELNQAMQVQSFAGVSGNVSFDSVGDRYSGVTFEVMNHAGESRLQGFGWWSELTEFVECTSLALAADEGDCHQVVWSTGAHVPLDGICADGSVFEVERNQCVPCSVGAFHDTTQGVCVPCARGSVNPDTGATSCLWCLYIQAGLYQDQEGQAACKECPEGADCSTGDSVVGLKGYWRDSYQRDQFYACSLEAMCEGEADPYVDSGCRVGHAGPLCSTCAARYVRADLNMLARCERCSDSERPRRRAALTALITAMLVLAMVVVFLYWPWIYYLWRGRRQALTPAAPKQEEGESGTRGGAENVARMATEAPVVASIDGAGLLDAEESSAQAEAPAEFELSAHFSTPGMIMVEKVRVRVLKLFSNVMTWALMAGKGARMACSRTQIGLYLEGLVDSLVGRGFGPWNLCTELAAATISFCQVVGTFTRLSVEWPKSLANVFTLLDISNVVRFDTVDLHCYLSLDFNERYVLAIGLACTLVIVFGLPCAICSKCIRNPSDRQVFKLASLKALIFVLFFCYPFLGAELLKVFPCRKLYETTYLMHDFSQECHTAEHTRMMLLGLLVGVIGFICGVPIFFYACMLGFKLPDVLHEKRRALQMANLLVYFASQPLIDARESDLSPEKMGAPLIARMHSHFYGSGGGLSCSDRGAAIEDFGGGCSTTSLPVPEKDLGGDEDLSDEESLQGDEDPLTSGKSSRKSALFSYGTALCMPTSKHAWKVERLLVLAQQPQMRVWHFTLQWSLFLGTPAEELVHSQKLEQNAIIHIGFLFTSYKPEFWYFEIVETLRKLVFVAIPVFFGSAQSQLLCSLGACATYLTVLQILQPDANSLNRTVKLSYAYMLLLNAFYGWMILAGVVSEGTESTVATTLAVMNILAFTIPFILATILAMHCLKRVYQQSLNAAANFQKCHKDALDSNTNEIKGKLPNEIYEKFLDQTKSKVHDDEFLKPKNMHVTVAALVIILIYPSPGKYHNYNHGAMFATEKVEGDNAPLFTKGEKLFTDQQTYAYREYRSKCEWRQSTVGKKKNRMCYQKWTRFQSILDPAPFECSDDLLHMLKYKNFSQDPLVLDCESRVDDKDDNSDVWRIQRIGPFYGGVKEGAYEWHNIIFHDPTDLKKVLRKGAELYITGSYLAIVDQVGDQISDYHAQLHNCQLYTDHLGEDVFERHGGKDCMDDPSGAKCLLYLELFPKGYAVKVDRPLKLSCTTHHMLNAKRGSDDTPFYYEIALRTSHTPHVPITRGAFVLPGDPWSIEEMRYIVPAVPSVKWATFRNPADQYLWFYSLQTNLSLMEEVWLFTTAADNIGLNQEPFAPFHEAPWQAYPLYQDKGMSTQTAKTHIMQHWEKRLRVLGHAESQEQKERFCSHLIRQWGLHLASVGAEAQGWKEYREGLKDQDTAGQREALCLYVMDHLEKYLENLERPALERSSFDVAKEPVEIRRHFCEFLMKDWHPAEGPDGQTAETLEQQQELCMFTVAHREELRDAEIPRQQERMCRLGFSDAVQMMPPGAGDCFGIRPLLQP